MKKRLFNNSWCGYDKATLEVDKTFQNQVRELVEYVLEENPEVHPKDLEYIVTSSVRDHFLEHYIILQDEHRKNLKNEKQTVYDDDKSLESNGL